MCMQKLGISEFSDLTLVLKIFVSMCLLSFQLLFTLVNVYVNLVVFMRIAGTSLTRSGRYWC